MTDRLRMAGVAVVFVFLGAAACSGPEEGWYRGEAVYGTCAPCHGIYGAGNEDLGAPAIAGLPEWYILSQIAGFENGYRGSHPQDTVGIRMKSMVRAFDVEGDLESVATYVASIPRVQRPATLGGDPQAGEQIYTTVCAGCHFGDAGGFEASQAPPLVGQHDWYMLSQFHKYVDGWRGGDPDDVWGLTMSESTGRVTEADMINAIAYIRTLPVDVSR